MASHTAAGGLSRCLFILVLVNFFGASALSDNRKGLRESDKQLRSHKPAKVAARRVALKVNATAAPTATPAAAPASSAAVPPPAEAAPVPAAPAPATATAAPATATALPAPAAPTAAPAAAPAGAVTSAPVNPAATAAPVTVPAGTAAVTTTAATVTEYQCASETSTNPGDCPECTMGRTCTCSGWVKYGYGDKWSPYYESTGSLECAMGGSVFTVDPYPGHSKICMCSNSLTNTTAEEFWSQPTNFGMWWPIGLVAIPASLIILVLTCARWSNQAHKLAPGPVELSLEAAVPTVLFFAPMVCVLYVAAAKRAEGLYLSPETSLLQEGHQVGGSPDLDGTNHILAERCIQISASAFLAQMIARIVFEWHAVKGTGERSDYVAGRKVQAWVNIYHITVVVCAIALVVLMVRVEGMGESTMPMPPIMDRVLGLSVPYFACYYCLHFCTFFSGTHAFAMALSKLACLNMNFAPMLCVLFLGIEVSADDNVRAGASAAEHPSDRAEGWVIWTTGTVIFQTVMSVLTPLCFGAQLKETPRQGEEDLMVHRDFLLLLINIVRWVAMAILYIGVWCLCQELWAENALPPRAHVLSFLAGVYFIIYGLMWATMTARQVLEGGDFRQCLRQLVVLKDLVAICPMIGAFFLGWWVVNE